MKIIFSHKDDYSTKIVLEWLNYFRSCFIRLNDEKIDVGNIVMNSDESYFTATINEVKIDSREIEFMWFRGGKVRITEYFYDPMRLGMPKSMDDAIVSFLSGYSMSKLEYLIHFFEKSASVGKNAQGRFNKIIALDAALKAGLDIPNTILTGSKTELVEFYKTHQRVITKSIDINFFYHDTSENATYNQYTSEITPETLQDIPEKFPLTMFQQLVEKRYDIRTFFLSGVCYSSAAFSQNNPKTQVDCRRYDMTKMNRIVPVKLPENVEKKVVNLMKDLDISSGSIDIIKDINGRFVFLEVNPIGQFGYISEVCNLNLYKKIAQRIADN